MTNIKKPKRRWWELSLKELKLLREQCKHKYIPNLEGEAWSCRKCGEVE
jgi:hypothetical protein